MFGHHLNTRVNMAYLISVFRYCGFCKQEKVVHFGALSRKSRPKSPSVYSPYAMEIAAALSGIVESVFRLQMSWWTTVPLSCRYVFSRGSLPLIKSPLIPFGAIILSELLNGRDSIIPPNRTQSNQLANLRESPPEPLAAGLCQED